MTITRVQYAEADTNAGGGTTSLTATFTNGATAGNLLVADVVVGSTASQGSCTTPTGWSLAVGPISNKTGVSPLYLYIFYKVATGGETGVTATDTVSSGITVQVWEWSASSGWPASPLDVTASSANQSSTGAPVTGTTATTAQAEELWIGLIAANKSTELTLSTPTNGFTMETEAWGGASAFFAPNTAALYAIASSTGAASSGVSSSPTGNFGGCIATFKPNTGGGGGTAYNQTVVDTQSATDSRLSQVAHPMTGDSQSGIDASVRNPSKLAADATSGTDVTGKTATKPASDALSGLDALAKASQKALFEAQSGLDSLTKATTAVLGDAQSALDTLSHLWSAHLLLSEAISGLDAAQKTLLLPLVEHFSETDSVNAAKVAGNQWTQTLTDHFSEVDVLASWSLVKLLGDVYSGTDVRTSQVGRALYDVSSGNDGLVKQLHLSLLEATSSVDRVSAGKVLLLTLLDQASLLDTPMTSYTKTQYGLLAMLTSLVASSLGVTLAFANSPALAASTTVLASALVMTITVLATNGLATSTTLLPTPLGMTSSLPF